MLKDIITNFVISAYKFAHALKDAGATNEQMVEYGLDIYAEMRSYASLGIFFDADLWGKAAEVWLRDVVESGIPLEDILAA